MNNARTLFEKIWSDHVVVVSPQGEELLYVDFNLINEGQSFLAFDQLRIEGRQSRRPEQHLAVTDHYLPTINRALGTAGRPMRKFAASLRCSMRMRRNSNCRMSAGTT